MQIDHAGGELTVLSRRRRLILMFASALGRVIKCPMLDIALAALHDGTTHPFPAFTINGGVGFWEVQILRRHHQLRPNPAKAKLPVRPLERKWMRHRRFATIKV